MGLGELKDSLKVLSNRRILIIGLGGLGRTYLELIAKYLDPKMQIFIFESNVELSCAGLSKIPFEITFVQIKLNAKNYQIEIGRYLNKGDILLNLTSTCDSSELIAFCMDRGIIYQDTAWGFWNDGDSGELPQVLQSDQISICKGKYRNKGSGLAIINFGINPGLISVLALKALGSFKTRYGQLPENSTILFTEYDSNHAAPSDRFRNSWSSTALWSEFQAPSEFYQRPSFRLSKKMAIDTEVQGWSYSKGIYRGFLVPHREVFSFYQSLNECDRNRVQFVGFCYHPPLSAIEGMRSFMENGLVPNAGNSGLILNRKGKEHYDEIGVLIGGGKSWLWMGYSFFLTNSKMHQVSTNSTLFLVAASAFSALLVCLGLEVKGVVEAEDVDAEAVLKLSKHFVGNPFEVVPQFNLEEGESFISLTEQSNLDRTLHQS